MTSRRLVTFGGITIAVESEGSATSSVIDFLFGDMDDTADHEPAASFEVRPMADGMLRLTRAGVLLNACDSPGGIAAHLACEVDNHAARPHSPQFRRRAVPGRDIAQHQASIELAQHRRHFLLGTVRHLAFGDFWFERE